MRSLLLLAFAGMLPVGAFSQDTTILYMNKYWNEVPAGQWTGYYYNGQMKMQYSFAADAAAEVCP